MSLCPPGRGAACRLRKLREEERFCRLSRPPQPGLDIFQKYARWIVLALSTVASTHECIFHPIILFQGTGICDSTGKTGCNLSSASYNSHAQADTGHQKDPGAPDMASDEPGV